MSGTETKTGNPSLLRREERVRMFFHEYYFGYGALMKGVRILGGPIILLMGLVLYQGYDRFSIAYGGFLIFFGIYLILKPLLWVIFRRDAFKSVEISIDATPEKLVIHDANSKSEILWGGIQKIVRRKNYFVLRLAKFTSIYLPVRLLNDDQVDLLSQISDVRTNQGKS